MKKWVRYMVLGTICLGLTVAGAAYADEKKDIVLIEETYNDYEQYGEIYRHYQIVGEQERLPYAIRLPDAVYQKVKTSDKPLVDAKKELTVAYRYLRLEKRLAELNGVYWDRFPNDSVRVSDRLNKTFQTELDDINAYADNALSLLNEKSDKEKASLYVVDDIHYVDYGKFDAFYKETEANYEEMKAAADAYQEDVDAMNESDGTVKIDETETKTPIGLYIGIAVLLLMMAALTVFVFQKKRG